MAHTEGASAHVAGWAGPQDPARLGPREPLQREPVEEFRARMEAKTRRQAQLRAATTRSFKVTPTRGMPDAFSSSGGSSLSAEPGLVEEPPAVRPVPSPPPSREVDPLEHDRLAAVTAYVSGDAIRDVCARLHRGEKTVRGWLVDAGVTIRPKGNRVGANAKRDAAIVAAYTAPDEPTTTDVATGFGVSRQTVEAVLRAAGVPARGSRPAAAATSTIAPPAVDDPPSASQPQDDEPQVATVEDVVAPPAIEVDEALNARLVRVLDGLREATSHLIDLELDAEQVRARLRYLHSMVAEILAGLPIPELTGEPR